MSATPERRYELLTTGPRVHYCLDTATRTLFGPHTSKRAARAVVDDKNGGATLGDLSDVEVLDRLAALDDLMDEARGDHPELAKVRRTIAEQIEPVLDECRARGLAH